MIQTRSQTKWLIPLTMVACVFMATACSREPQPIVDGIKPAQQTLEKAREVEQTMQKSQENQKKALKD